MRFTIRHLVFASYLLILLTASMFVVSFVKGNENLKDVFGNVYMPDFVAHYTGGHFANRSAETIYSVVEQQRLELALTKDPDFLNLYISPPYVTPIYAPLAALPLGKAMIVWTLISAALLIAAFMILRPYATNADKGHVKSFVLFGLAFQPVQEVFGSGQDTPITILLWALGIHFALSKRELPAGLVFGLGAFKPQLFVLPFLFFGAKKRWQGMLGMIISAAACLSFGVAKYGVAGFRAWLAILRTPEYLELVRKHRVWKMSSISATVEGLVPDSLDGAARVVGFVLAFALVAVTVRVLVRAQSERYAWALTSLTAVIASPHLFSYDLALLLVPALLILGETWSPAMVKGALTCAILIWLSGVRANLFVPHPWPISALATSLTAPALWFVWRELARRTQNPPVIAAPVAAPAAEA